MTTEPEITNDQRQALQDWIESTFFPTYQPGRSRKCRNTSYFLKGEFERTPRSFYLTDSQFRAEMQAAGYQIDRDEFTQEYIFPHLYWRRASSTFLRIFGRNGR